MTANVPGSMQPTPGAPAWTPPPRRGIVPLHPLPFGTVLGRSFTALRQNPRVLLGFALGWQMLGYVIAIGGTAAIGWASFSRLDTVRYGSPEFDAIQAGSTAITIIVGIVLGVAMQALGVVIQAIVVAEVAHEVLAEKLRLGALWRQVRPVFWRLIGYSALLLAAIVVGVGVAVVLVVAFAAAGVPIAAVLIGVFTGLGAVVLYVWLGTKLLLTPSAILLERQTIRGGIARSWRLTRTRFWPIFGVIIVINLIFQVLAQIVTIPINLLGSILTVVVAPTGGSEGDILGSTGFIVTLVAVEAVALLISAIQTVVQSTAAGLLYVDARMRHEGLDLDLLSYVEQRDAGAAALPDPYTVGIGRATPQRYQPHGGYAPPQPGAPYASYAPPAPGQPQYAPAPVQYAGQPRYAPAPPQYAPAPPQSSPAAPAPARPAPVAPAPAPAAAPAPAPAPDPTSWTAPGEQPDEPPA